MSPTELSVAMLRRNLDDPPEFPLPAGISLRSHEPRDAAHWLRIQSAADSLNVFDAETFRHQFGEDESLHRARILYLCDCAHGPVGTAAAWFGELEPGAGIMGRVHWVAILPEFQGRGLSRPLLAATLQRLRSLGHQRAYLTTSTARPVAIHLYRRFGFEPYMRNDEERAAWKSL